MKHDVTIPLTTRIKIGTEKAMVIARSIYLGWLSAVGFNYKPGYKPCDLL